MDQNRSTFDIREGMDIIGSDGGKLGSVDHFEGDNVVVKGGLFSGEHVIPISAIAQADADQAYLNVTKDAAENGQWLAETETMTGTENTMVTDQTRGTSQAGTLDRDVNATRSNVSGDDDITVELAEEELTAQKRAVDRGAVEIEKDVVAEEKTLEVPVTEERVEVSRRSVDRDLGAGETAFEEGTIEVPIRGEEVDVQKTARVTEEVEISKDAVQEKERVTDTVRHEEVDIDTSGTNVADASTTGKGRKRGGKRNS